MTAASLVFRSACIALLAAGVTACSSTSKGVLGPVTECAYPDAPKESAPLWVCDAPVEGVSVSAVGMADKSAAGVSFMKNMAAADARVKLAQQMKVHVNNMIKQYVETTGAGSSETVDKVNTSVSKLITSESLEGSRIFRTTTSPNGAMYVLLGLDPSVTRAATEKAVKTSMKNDQALWQQFKAKKAQDEMAADIARMAAEGR